MDNYVPYGQFPKGNSIEEGVTVENEKDNKSQEKVTDSNKEDEKWKDNYVPYEEEEKQEEKKEEKEQILFYIVVVVNLPFRNQILILTLIAIQS